MRKIIKEWIFMYIVHKETRTEIECTEVKSCYYIVFKRTTSVLILTFKIKKRMKEQGLG